MGYVVSKKGTFGVVSRRYHNDKKEPCIVIKWGPLGWLTPVLEKDTKHLESCYQSEALKEAKLWMEQQGNSGLEGQRQDDTKI